MLNWRQVMERYRKLSPQSVTEGTWWYPRARAIAATMHPVPEIGAGVLAALSPRTRWTKTIEYARVAIGLGERPRGCLGVCWAKAHQIALGQDPLSVLRGPKERAFYDNILKANGSELVTVDVWMLRMLEHGPEVKSPAHYSKVARPILRASWKLGLPPTVVQAGLWCQMVEGEDVRQGHLF